MPLLYNDYLHVPSLINLQHPQSSPAHHDELLFIIVHQAYELWFKQILHELAATLEFLRHDQIPQATYGLRRVVEIEGVLLSQIRVLETMTPQNFAAFRDRLNPASGFQSSQFREIEFVSGLKDERMLKPFKDDEFALPRLLARMAAPSLGDEFFSLLTRLGYDAPPTDPQLDEETQQTHYRQRVEAVAQLMRDSSKYEDVFQLAELMVTHDELIMLWRVHHVRMVERMIGSKRGTGGSEGAGYLLSTINKRFFPELWEARTIL